MKLRSVLPLLLLLGISFSLAWLAFARQEKTKDRSDPSTPDTIALEARGNGWRAVDTRSGIMGTRFSVEVSAADRQTAVRACVEAYRRIEYLETCMSSWRPDSNLSLVNRTAAGEPVPVDPDTFSVLTACRRMAATTGGSFDPTVRPLLVLWRKSLEAGRVPGTGQIAAARARVGMHRVSLDPDAFTVAFDGEGVSLDLGAIGKGFSADAAAWAALSAGADACRVNAGGDHVARGSPAWEPRGFAVAVRDPAAGEADTLPGLSFFLKDQAVATSGNYERFTVVDGKRYGHILDPVTGSPVVGPVVQVTVLAPSGHAADALATAFTVMGKTKGLSLTESLPRTESMFAVREDDRLEFYRSSGFPRGTQ